MAITKESEFNKRQARLAELAKALAHPARIAILEILSQEDTCMCGDIAEMLPLAQSTVSQHLKVLKEAGFIQGTITGQSICYDLNPDTFKEYDALYHIFTEKISGGPKIELQQEN